MTTIATTESGGPTLDVPAAAEPISTPSARQGWTWMILACVLVGICGGVREWQNRVILRDRAVFEPCPFPIESVPFQLGDWVSNPGETEVLDDLTIRITGSTDRWLRRYTNRYTGVRCLVLLLYGPAEPVLPHTPTICFPANGYAREGGEGMDTIPVDGKPALFRTATYSLTSGIQYDRVRSYYSFRLDDQWSPDAGSGRRFHRVNPGIFKVQIQRSMRRGEKPVTNEPMDELIALLIADVEARITRSRAPRPVVADQTPLDRSRWFIGNDRIIDRRRSLAVRTRS